jgi:hypothetical protein
MQQKQKERENTNRKIKQIRYGPTSQRQNF